MNNIESSSLYEQDYYLWLQDTYQKLEKKDINGIDLIHLMEEILALGNEQKRKVSSYLRQLIIHLLLYQYWESERERCDKGWQTEIDDFRFELELLLKSKTLYNYFLQEIEEIYPKARKQVIKKTDLPAAIFPEHCPFKADQLLDSDFLP
ncbi:MAG: DUF29 domain-containing protein [Planktothrix sp.]